MGVFQVDSEQVLVASTSVHQSATTLSTEVTRMMNGLTQLQASWKGGAASQFQTLVDGWRLTQTQVQQSLEQINLALQTAGLNYQSTEADNLRMFVPTK